MKKVGKIIGWVFFGFLALAVIGSMMGEDEPGTKVEPAKEVAKVEESKPAEETAAPKEEAPAEQPKAEAPKEEPKEDTTFAFGEEAVFDSGLAVKVVGVTETAERNQFADPANFVMVVQFEFTNNTGAELVMTSHEFKLVDSTGFQGIAYPQGDQIVTIAPGTKARANMHYGVDGAGPYKVIGGIATWQ